MKLKLTLSLIVLAVVISACASATPTPQTTADVPVVVDSGQVIAEGRLEPGTSAQISFLTGGQVAEVLVSEGDAVQAGDLLARLANREGLQAQVAQAEQAVLEAQQALEGLTDVAALTKAQTERELAQAQDNLERAERRLKNVTRPDISFYQDELKKAQDALATAQENATITNIGDIENALTTARDRLETASDIVNDAQIEQDKCPGCEFVYAAAAGTFVKLEDTKKNLTDAADAVKVLELRLEQARRGDAQTIKDLQERVDDAQANLNSAKNPDVTDVSAAQAEVNLLKASIEDAKRRLADLQNGPDPDQLAAAQARLNTAQANLEAAKAALANTELRAPISGTVSDVNLKVGEQVAPGLPVIVLAEFSKWVVKTNNLTEIEVVNVQVGQVAEVVLDALPDVTLSGTVEKIATVFIENRGDVTYTITVALTEVDPRARWGMTAQVTVEP